MWLAAVLAAIVVLVAVYQFNRMVVLRNRIRESWGNVDTELRRRHDLVPNLVAAVKGYAAHERQVLESVVAARARAAAPHGRRQEAAAHESVLAGALERLLAVAEAYPRLRASEGFLRLQAELANTEDRIQASRRFYNANVRDYRNQTRQFPGVLFAAIYRMGPIDFFEVSSLAVRRAPRVEMA